MAGMTFERLRIFIAVAECLHFSRAAEELYVTQSAVSAAIQKLEAEYSVKLFHRIGRRIEITEAGKLLKMEAQKILDQVALTERGLRELNNLQRGELNLGSSFTIGNYWLPHRISEFQRQYPNICVNCNLANAETICEGTVSGQFDLGLVEGAVQPSLKSYLEEEKIASDRLMFVVGKSHPWFKRKEIFLPELYTTTWIMRESGSGTQQRLEQALKSWGIETYQLNVILVLSSGEMIKKVVENGFSAAGMSELAIKKELKLDTLRSIQIKDDREEQECTLEIIRPFLKLKHRQRFQTHLCKAFEQMLATASNSNINFRSTSP